jgi:hypothetical protein
MNGTSFNTGGAITEISPGLLLVPTGGKIVYVHSSGAGALDALPPNMVSSADGFVTSVQLALNTCRSGRGDKIICLPGHTESITADAWSNLSTKTDIEVFCVPAGGNTATFTWTVAGSTLLMDAASFRIRNARMFMSGATAAALTVAAPITVSAADCQLTNCRMFAGFDVDNGVTIGVTTTAAADRFIFDDNVVRGSAAGGAALTTTFLRVVGGDSIKIRRNDIICGTSAAAVGPIQNLTTEATNVEISDNKIQNNAASSTACITWALANSTGWIERNKCRNMTDGSFAHIVVTSGDMQLFGNEGVNNSNESNRVLFLGTASA